MKLVIGIKYYISFFKEGATIYINSTGKSFFPLKMIMTAYDIIKRVMTESLFCPGAESVYIKVLSFSAEI